MKNRTLLILLTATFIVGLAAFAPASLIEGSANRAMAPHAAIKISAGTIWSGTGTLLLFPAARPLVVPVSWRFDPLALLQLRIGYYVHAKSASIAGNTRIGAGFGSIQLSNTALKIDMSLVSRLQPLVSLLNPKGALAINIDDGNSVTVAAESSSGVLTADGSCIAQIANLTLRNLSPRPLGSYAIAIKLKNSQAEFVVDGATGPLKLDGGGSVTWGSQRNFTYHGMAGAPLNTNGALLLAPLLATGKLTPDGRVKININTKW